MDEKLKTLAAEVSEPEEVLPHEEAAGGSAAEGDVEEKAEKGEAPAQPKQNSAIVGENSEEPKGEASAPAPLNMDNVETQAMFDSRAEGIHSDAEGGAEKRAERSLLKAGLLQ